MKVRIVRYGIGAGATWAVECIERRLHRPAWVRQFDAREHGRETAVRWVRRRRHLSLLK